MRSRQRPSEIGKRAALALLEREAASGVSTREQLESMDLDRRTLYCWGTKGDCPSGSALARLACAGYDMMFILTGRKTE